MKKIFVWLNKSVIGNGFQPVEKVPDGDDTHKNKRFKMLDAKIKYGMSI